MIRSIASVAWKEFLHIVRDWRILVLILTLPPAFTLLLGHAFEASALAHAPALLHDADDSPQSRALVERLRASESFAWRETREDRTDLLHAGVRAALTIPPGWGGSVEKGEPAPLRLLLDGMDGNTAEALEGAVRAVLGAEQFAARAAAIERLPEEVRRGLRPSLAPWVVESTILYNPELRFIDFVMSGIVGLILQLLTVTLMACTIAREREAGTLAQLLVTPLRRHHIVIGKVLPYLAVAALLIAMTLATGHFHFGVQYREPWLLTLLCLLFLLCSLGTGLIISAFCATQAQAIQFAVFYLIPVFPLAGAFAPLEQLPESVRAISALFPLTHFCHGFRLVCLGQAGAAAIAGDLLFLALGALLTCAGASLLLSRMRD